MHLALESDPRISIAGAARAGAPTGAGAFLEWFEETAARFGERTALRARAGQEWRELSYGALAAEARAVGSWLVEQGIARGATIGLIAASGPEWVVAFFAALESGATLVPIDPKLTAPEIANLLAHARPRIVLASPDQATKAAAACDAVGSVRQLLVLDEVNPFASMRPRVVRAPLRRQAGEVALIVYTSGTTGSPKGVEITFGNLLFETQAMDRVIGPQGEERFLSVLPLNHLYELICGLLTPLHRGATITYTGSLLPDDVAALLQGERITSVVGVPLLFSALQRGIERAVRARGPEAERRFERAQTLARWIPGSAARRKLFAPVLRAFAPALRACYSGGAALDVGVAGFFARMGIPVYQGYGLSEASPVIATNAPGANRIGSVGRPLAGVEVRIVRRSEGDLAGEIQTRGPHVMAGYRNDAGATGAALSADGWLATGDLGFIDGSGFLWVTGRSKDLVVLGGGKKVHPDEVEEALARSPLFAEVCVLGAPARAGMASGFEEVWVVVVPGPSLAANEDLPGAVEAEVNRATRELAPFKRPTRIALRSEPLPRTATRKIQKPLVREWLAARPSPPAGKPHPGQTTGA